MCVCVHVCERERERMIERYIECMQLHANMWVFRYFKYCIGVLLTYKRMFILASLCKFEINSFKRILKLIFSNKYWNKIKHLNEKLFLQKKSRIVCLYNMYVDRNVFKCLLVLASTLLGYSIPAAWIHMLKNWKLFGKITPW